MARDIERVVLTYSDSRRPGIVEVNIKPTKRYGISEPGARLTLSTSEAAVLMGRLGEAIRGNGYELVAKKRAR